MDIKKIQIEEAIRSTTMFLNDAEIESEFETAITTQIAVYKKMSDISTRDGLERYIRSTPDSISRLITLLGITREKFKRVVTMLRVEKGYTFDSEWDEARVQRELCVKSDLMNEICELFLNGCNMDKYKEMIPHFVLQDFRIDKEIIGRLYNDDMLRELTKSSVFTKYNKAYSNLYAKKIQNKIMEMASLYGLHYKFKVVDGLGKENLHVITNSEKNIVVNYQFNVTTSKSQTDYADKTIHPIWQKSRQKKGTVVVNMLDGAGWVGRAADYRKIFIYCDYFLNLKNINQLEDIIKQTFNID